MKEFELRPYQKQAISAIQEALIHGQRRIAIEMPPGFGKGIVLAKVIEYLQKTKAVKILIVVGNLMLKEKISREISANYNGSVSIDNSNIVVETEHKLLNNSDERISEYNPIVFYDAGFKDAYQVHTGEEKTAIIFSTFGNDIIYENKVQQKPYSSKDIVFSYTFQEAINDGYITPAMDARARGPALEVFSKHLLESYGYSQIDYEKREHDSWDLVLQKSNQKLWVECKAYKSQDVSPYVANELLKTLIMRKMKHKLSQEDVILLIVSSNIPSYQKDEIFKRYRIVVWDLNPYNFITLYNPT